MDKPILVDYPSLAQKRVMFTLMLSELILWANLQGFKLALGEGYVAVTDAKDGDYDGPHKKTGGHYTGLAMDLILYRPDKNGKLEYISDGGDPVWTAIGTHWEQMHSLCRWGGRFQDPNHFSLIHQGVQ